MSSLVHQGGSVKREAEPAHGVDKGVGSARGAGWGVRAAHGTVSSSKVPAIEEGSGGAIR
jgi:hypothetical protein